MRAPAQIRPTALPVWRRRAILTGVCWCYLAALAGFWAFLHQAGDRWWVATLVMLSPRWPLLIPLCVLGVWVAAFRRWWLLVPVFAATWLMVGPVMGLRVSLPGAGTPRGEIRLVTCNVHRQHLEADHLAEFIDAVRPDIVTLQGWSETNHESLFAGGGWERRQEGELLIASRFPITRVTPVDFRDDPETPVAERGAAALVELQGPRGTIYLITLHLASPHGGLMESIEDSGGKLAANVERRWRESAIVRSAADEVKGPLLLAGDFNTTDDSPIFREHWEEYADSFAKAGCGFGFTYVNGHTQIRIDHIMGSPACRFVRCWLGPDVGSPHRPLVADVDCR
jgi:vancomycin resistance protein VanJ